MPVGCRLQPILSIGDQVALSELLDSVPNEEIKASIQWEFEIAATVVSIQGITAGRKVNYDVSLAIVPIQRFSGVRPFDLSEGMVMELGSSQSKIRIRLFFTN